MTIERIQIRRGTTAEWASANPVLSSGEFGLDTDEGRVRIGDGAAAWSALGWFGGITPEELKVLPGTGNTAAGANAHASGANTSASGDRAHAEGDSTSAAGNNSHAEGAGTVADGENAHAQGSGTQAHGDASHAEGWFTQTNNDYTHVEGLYANAFRYAEHAEGSFLTGGVNGLQHTQVLLRPDSAGSGTSPILIPIHAGPCSGRITILSSNGQIRWELLVSATNSGANFGARSTGTVTIHSSSGGGAPVHGSSAVTWTVTGNTSGEIVITPSATFSTRRVLADLIEIGTVL